jgi:hypothetical protein
MQAQFIADGRACLDHSDVGLGFGVP